jgi:nitrate/nitrite transporter NarK
LYGVIGLAGASACYGVAILGAINQNMWVFAIGVALSGFCNNDLTMGPSWAVCQDIGRRYSAIVSGFMNMIGNLGGVTTIIVTAWIMKLTVEAKQAEVNAMSAVTGVPATAPQYEAARVAGEIEGYIINLSLYAIAYAIGVIFWLKIDATKPIVDDNPESATAEPPL